MEPLFLTRTRYTKKLLEAGYRRMLWKQSGIVFILFLAAGAVAFASSIALFVMSGGQNAWVFITVGVVYALIIAMVFLSHRIAVWWLMRGTGGQMTLVEQRLRFYEEGFEEVTGNLEPTWYGYRDCKALWPMEGGYVMMFDEAFALIDGQGFEAGDADAFACFIESRRTESGEDGR